MELLTHGGEHHEIGDGGRLMMTMATDSPLRSPERTPDQPSRERLGLGCGSVSETRLNFFLDFFLAETEYMELELRSAEPQGAHKTGGRAQVGRARPHLCGQGVGPLWLILSPVFFIYSKTCLREVSGLLELCRIGL